MSSGQFLLTDFLLTSTHFSTSTASFPIISIVKLARKRVLLEFLTLVERYWRLSTETFETYTEDVAGKLRLIFKLQSLHYV